MKVFDRLDLTGPGVVLGRHSAWLPDVRIKVPFQFGGRITKYTHPGEDETPVEDTLPHELAILRALAQRGMAPPIGDLVYFREVVSVYDGAWRCDPVGAYGFEMGDASKLGPGRFSLPEMKTLPIKGSVRAWADVVKKGNIRNGYAVDVRRTAWDMLRWAAELPVLEKYQEDLDLLEDRIRRDCQFPKGERKQPYQDVWIGDRKIEGARHIEERAGKLGFFPAPGESVLDVGCQTGGMLQHSWRQQSPKPGTHVGIEIDGDYVECARAAARANGQNLCIRKLDVTDNGEFAKLADWSRLIFKGAPDHLLLLSMEKHIGESCLWKLVDTIIAKRTYIETNAMRPGAYRLRAGVERRGGWYVGDSDCRNTRRLYVIPA